MKGLTELTAENDAIVARVRNERILCPDCHGAGETYFASKNHPGFVSSIDCDRCDCDGEIDFDLSCLARNLAVAGVLCRAFALGGSAASNHYHFRADNKYALASPWTPGCGWSAP